MKLSIVLAVGLTLATAGNQSAKVPISHRTVLAELFTSEGCSSCPPADDLLARLVNEQPVNGVTIVALGEHVDYWDRLGWRDPFSSSLFSDRQSSYDARVFRTGRIYTPQIVVDGHLEAIGSSESAVYSAVRRAAQSQKADVVVTWEARPDAAVRVSVRVDVPSGLSLDAPADVMVALTEDRLATNVRRGENRGRLLKHAAVVRRLATVGQVALHDGMHTATATLALAPEWKRENLRVIAFVQEQKTRRIVGAGSQSLR
jgi:hypothetical protein